MKNEMKDLIEKLKDNKVGWKFLTQEEQGCMRQANAKGMVENLKFAGGWESNIDGWHMSKGTLGANEIFRIKADYQPEPEYVDLKIVSKEGFLGVYNSNPINIAVKNPFIHLHCLLSLPNFEGFYYDNVGEGRCWIAIGWIASELADGKKIYARFRL